MLLPKQSLFTNYLFLLTCILFLAAVLRFVNYDARFGLASDQARDALIIQEAVKEHTLPLIGAFSASGPFVFGPYFYWAFYIPVALFPHFVLTPWIFLTLLYIGIVGIMFSIGEKVYDRNFGLLLAFFTAISPVELSLSSNLIYSALVGFFATCTLYFFVSYIKAPSRRFLFFFALFLSLSVNTHFEAMPLLLMIPFVLYFGKRTLSHMSMLFLGLLLPLTPLIIFNFEYHFYELNNIIHFILFHPQTTLVTKRWLTTLTSSWPTRWGDTIGGTKLIGGIEIILLLLVAGYSIYAKKIQKEIGIVMGVFICMVVMLRYFNGIIFESFLAFIIPFILLLFAWACYEIVKRNVYIGMFILFCIVCANTFVIYQTITKASNPMRTTTIHWVNKLATTKAKTFSVYQYKSQQSEQALSLSLYLNSEGKAAISGDKIALASFGAPINEQVLFTGHDRSRMYTLQGVSDASLTKEGFSSISAKSVYNATENWYK